MKKFALLSLATLALSGLASASLIPTFSSQVGTTYNYTAALDANEQLNNNVTLAGNTCTSTTGGTNVPCGQFFTLFDIPNLVSVASGDARFTASINLIGNKNNLTGLPIADNPIISNATFTYTSGTPLVGPQNVLGLFSVTTTGTILGSNNIAFAFSTAHMPNTGFADQGAGVVNGPTLAGVPEPGSMLLIGGGLVGLALLRRKLVS